MWDRITHFLTNLLDSRGKNSYFTSHMDTEVIIIGAGGAGLMCALQAGKRGRKVVLLDHAKKLGGKILISGGGRCNFTNFGATPAQYVSQNPHFCKSALARYSPWDFIELVQKHGIAFHEKKLGQQFCDDSAAQIVTMLERECQEVNAEIALETEIKKLWHLPESDLPLRFQVETSGGSYRAESLVIATGGLSIPKIGATGLGYQIAKQFGLKVTDRVPALDGFTLAEKDAKDFEGLAGLSADVIMECNGISFRENILYTHAGMSGPVTLQASLHWSPGQIVTINFLPDLDAYEWLVEKKNSGDKSLAKNILAEVIPSRLADRMCELYFPTSKPFAQVKDAELKTLADKINAFTFVPAGTVGYSKAEVTRGGVDTAELSSKTMEAKKVPGLYFIGEVVDVTGWLGGYNFQWAWASGTAAALVV
jgi:predicted Rossmann fold flavoprotein